MAFKKRTTSKSRGRSAGYSKRTSSSRGNKGRSASSSRRATQTLRIVVEAPQGNSSMPQSGFQMPANQNKPRKAKF